MNFKKHIKIVSLFFMFSCFFFSGTTYAYEIFIYRPYLDKKPISREKKIIIHGEFFGQLQAPGTFPSYNDLSGAEDRWNYGFQNIIFFTKNTYFLAQLVTHADPDRRTKFDWHFSFRHLLLKNLILIVGHDSNHDSDYMSLIDQKRFYVNRNYVGFGLPSKTGLFYIEPFAWFFLHNTKQRVHLDLSGNDMRQEYGVRIGMWYEELLGFHFQILSQSEKVFSFGQAILADLIIRVRLLDWFELSLGGGLWKDIKKTPIGNKQTFHKLIWGIAIPF